MRIGSNVGNSLGVAFKFECNNILINISTRINMNNVGISTIVRLASVLLSSHSHYLCMSGENHEISNTSISITISSATSTRCGF